MSELEGSFRELQLHDPFILPDELELEHEINRPRWWYAQQLRLAGASWDEIAKALGYGSGSSAHTTVKRELTKAEIAKSSAQELMELDLERLDMLQIVVWRQARNGDLKAIEAILKIMATRAKYLGLDKGAAYEDESAKATIFIGGDSESYLEGIKAAQDLHRTPIEGEIAS